jgi:hypothetical protein
MASIADRLQLACPAGVALTQTSSDANRALASTFGADGTYSGTQAWSGSIVFEVPLACLEGGSCNDLEAAIGVFVDPGNGLLGATCGGTSTCSCTFTYGGTRDEAGTYTTSGTTLTTTAADGTVNDTPYCVSGSFLHLDFLVGTEVTSDVVLARP